MKLETKFDVGQKVYVKGTSRWFNIDQIVIKSEEDRIDVIYQDEWLPDFQKFDFREDELTTKKPKPQSVFGLTEDDDFYVLMPGGSVLADAFDPDWGDDRDVVAMGNAFLSEEEAHKEAKHRRIRQELKKLANGYQFESEKANYSLVLNPTTGEVKTFVTVTAYNPDTVYFGSEKDALDAIKAIGKNRLLVDYFGIAPTDDESTVAFDDDRRPKRKQRG